MSIFAGCGLMAIAAVFFLVIVPFFKKRGQMNTVGRYILFTISTFFLLVVVPLFLFLVFFVLPGVDNEVVTDDGVPTPSSKQIQAKHP